MEIFKVFLFHSLDDIRDLLEDWYSIKLDFNASGWASKALDNLNEAFNKLLWQSLSIKISSLSLIKADCMN